MISVHEAERLILEHACPLELGSAQTSDPRAVIAEQALVADRPLPPFDRVMMDGVAIMFESYALGVRRFAVEGTQKAGSPRLERRHPDTCIEVMTGAPLPKGCDTVVPYEQLSMAPGIAELVHGTLQPGQHIHRVGADAREGDELQKSGAWMSPARWAIAASVGVEDLRTFRSPRVAIVSTGDELVGVGDRPSDFQIRRSNPVAIRAALSLFGFTHCRDLHVEDEPQRMLEVIEDVLCGCDAVVISGGVSKGRFDYVPSVLADAGVQQIFHGVRQRPGKPLWFGVRGKTLVFGLPGNPTSSLLTSVRYVIPALCKATGHPAPKYPRARLSQSIPFDKPLTLFAPVSITFGQDATIEARPIAHQGSGDYASLANCDGFIELPAENDHHPAGQCFPWIPWRMW